MTTNSKPRVQVKNGEIVKASNMDTPVSRLRVSGQGTGYANLRNIQDYVDQEQVTALRWPHSLSTYDKMFYDHDVQLGYFLSQIFVEKAFEAPDFKYNEDSAESKEAMEFVKWNLSNMKGTLQQAIRDAYTCKKYGFSVLVKNYTTFSEGDKFNGKYKYKLSKLSPRAQKTLNATNPFLVNDSGEITHARQDYKSLNVGHQMFLPKVNYGDQAYADIPANKFMLFSYDSTNGNPLGRSVCQSVYKPWREKTLISDYEVIGTSKDVGGTPILTAPSDVLARAAEDKASDEAIFMKTLQTSLANWHAGDTAYMILPSDISEGSTTQKMFDVKLIGVESGGGKMYDSTALIAERQKAILNAFGAGFAILGQQGSGSYALADTQKGTHAFFIEKDINLLLEVFNNDLIPQLLALNDIRLNDEDMPKMIHGIVDEKDVDLVSKAVQRVAAVSAVPKHPALMNEVLEDLGYDYQIPQDVLDDPEKWAKYREEFMGEMTSRSGDGLESGLGSGTGAATGASGDADTSSTES